MGYEPGPTHEYTLKQVYQEYKNYCAENGYRPCSNKVFKERLKKHEYSMVRKMAGYSGQNKVFIF